MEISLTHYGVSYSVKTKNDDLTASEVLDIFLGILKAGGWAESTIHDTIIELGEMYKDEDN